MAKEKPVCRYCGSDDVTCDSVSSWNEDKQEWEHISSFDSGNCNACDNESKYFDWVEIEEPKDE